MGSTKIVDSKSLLRSQLKEKALPLQQAVCCRRCRTVIAHMADTPSITNNIIDRFKNLKKHKCGNQTEILSKHDSKYKEFVELDQRRSYHE